MSSAHPISQTRLDLSSHDFKIVIRALTGDLNRTGKKPQEQEEAKQLGIKLLSQYVKYEEDQLKRLRGFLGYMQADPKETPESQEPVLIPVITELRPGSVVGDGSMGHGKAVNFGSLRQQ